MMPAEVMLLPKWFPFHLDKISYWSRTVIVPLLVLLALKPRAKNAKGVRIDELFLAPPEQARLTPRAPQQNKFWFAFFRVVDHVLRAVEPLLNRLPTRQRSIKAAEAFTIEHLNGEDGIGAIFPAMVNSVLMFDVLGYPADHPHLTIARALGREAPGGEGATRPIASPACRRCGTPASPATRMLEVGGDAAVAQVNKGLEWLKTAADPRRQRRLGGGAARRAARRLGVPVQQRALSRRRRHRGGRDGDGPRAEPAGPDRPTARRSTRAREWIFGMQSKNGGWGAFDADNDHYYLNHIPFADHGALLDPPTEDVSARCVSMLAQLGDSAKNDPRMAQAVDYLLKSQHPEGSWYGRWGMNYIYGTWSVLCALNTAGVDHRLREVRKAVDWLVKIQNADGGWGEDGSSYKLDYKGYEPRPRRRRRPPGPCSA